MAGGTSWSVAGSYYEACNCQAVCPCRRLNGAPGGDSTYGVCQFLLSWHIQRGAADGVDLAGRQVVMAGCYRDDEAGRPWSIKLCVDEGAEPEPYRQLEGIFLGRAGGNMPFTSSLFETCLSHFSGAGSPRPEIRVSPSGSRTRRE